MKSFYFVMPAYNEVENIEQTILSWYPVVEKIESMPEYTARLVIADDGSKDETYQKMMLLKQEKRLRLFDPISKYNSGHGATVLYLYRYALSNGADFIFQTDSDGQTEPEEFWQMFENKDEFDFQIGHRNDRQDGLGRVFVTKVLRLFVWLMFGVWVTDANTPFRLMRSTTLSEILTVIPEDYSLSNVAISAIAVKWKKSVRFYPITFKPRQGGVNSINFRRIFKIGLKAIGDFYHINKNLSIIK